MEMLKELVNIIKDMPETALWVMAGFLFYKLVIVGSVYGTIKFCVTAVVKIYEKSREPKFDTKTVKYEFDVSQISIKECFPDLLTQLERLKGKGTGIDSNYIHRQSVAWLKSAIDEAEKRDEMNNVTHGRQKRA